MPTNQPSGHDAWNGPPRMPPPYGRRTTRGIGMPLRQCVLAATVTRGSKAHDDEVGELQLDDRALAHPGGADRGTHEPLLRDRGVDHARVAELLPQPLGDPERAPEVADVLADQEHAVVARERVAQRERDRVEVGDRVRHGAEPSPCRSALEFGACHPAREAAGCLAPSPGRATASWTAR